MTEQQPEIIGPDGQAVPPPPVDVALGDLVEQPAKVMRIGGMIRQLLEEVKAAPLDEPSRTRLRDIHLQSIKELEDGLAPELVDELERLSLPFDNDTPSEGELRIAQAQLVGWLEGLFHGIQAALYAQQVQAQSQFQNMRLALPGPNDTKGEDLTTSGESSGSAGMYL
ncbi:bacterial proteasome activator family protein [Aeromicrobium sp.]|uniref:bacterial proteasome activator family protein n=1 Tax=Aeromicrobium sp. TaxID=1871063 RepID=UPI003C31662A